jgi:hypothetical protein
LLRHSGRCIKANHDNWEYYAASMLAIGLVVIAVVVKVLCSKTPEIDQAGQHPHQE